MTKPNKKPPKAILPRSKATSKAKLVPGPRTRVRRKIAAYVAQERR
jgi:hypothetical protein